MLQSLFRRSRTARVPLQNGHINLQRVSVTRQSRPFMSRVLSSFLISYCVISTASYIFPKEQHAKEAQPNPDKARPGVEGRSNVSGSPQNALSKSLPGTELHQDEVSVPLLFSIRKRRGAPYLPGDQDWKAFQQLQQDKKLVRDIKVEVAKQVEKEAKKRAQLAPFFRALRPTEMRVNLDLVVPLHRPPVYEVPYVVIKPGGETVLVWRRLPDSFGSKLDRAFHPIILSKAFYYGLKEFWVVSYRITKARVQDRLNSAGLSTGGSHSSNNSSSSSNKINPFYLPPLTRPRTEEEKTKDTLPTRQASDKEMKKFLPFLRGKYGEHESRQGYRDAVKSMTYQGAIESACAVFRVHWAVGQAQAAQTDARDPCHIIGYVEFVGNRGKLRLDVMAIYSPKAKGLVGQPVITKAYGMPDATKWYEPLSRRGQRGLILPEPTKSTNSKQRPQPTEQTEPETEPPAAEKERREVGSREEERGEEK